METLRFSVWQLLVEGLALTSVPALIALTGSMLVARCIARLTSFERTTLPVAAAKNSTSR